MASMNFYSLVLVAVALVSMPLAIVAGDPDILTDFVVPTMWGIPMNITGYYFTYTGFAAYELPVITFSAQKASMKEFPALEGQSVSYAKLMFPPGTVNPTHSHPRAAELLLVIEGALSVGFIDTAGKLYTKDLVAGDMFVFPKVKGICPRGNNKVVIILFHVYEKMFISHAIIVFTGNVNTCVFNKQEKGS